MYKHLYDKFQNWFQENRGQVWFYSDPHFGDDEMKYIRYNYISDEEQVKRINSKIGKYDTLVILGDIGDVEWVKKLRGYKVLIMGNHDSGASNYKHQNKFEAFDNHLFDEVYEGPIFISDRILLSHEPIDFPFALNIHGHDHSGKLFKDNNHINVCAECIDYTPINLKYIIGKGILKNIDNIHRITINIATERKQIEQ